MFSRRIILTAVAAGATAAAIAGAVPAYALSTVNVTAGSATSGTSVAVQGASTATLQLKDLNTNATGSCASSSLTGTTKAGANSPANFAQVNGGSGQITFNTCATLGLPFTINGVGTTKWTIAATGNTASGVTPINITGINVLVDSSSCSFNVTGSAAGTLTNGTSASAPSKIAIAATTASTSNLTVSNYALKGSATKCLAGAVTNTSPGNKISLSATYNVSATNSAYNPVTAIAS